MTESINIDDLLDATLDDLEDMPTFEPYPPGAHRVLATMEQKEIAGHPAIEVSFKSVETLELSEPTKDTAPEAGATANVACMMDNEFGRGSFKMFVAAIGTAIGLEPATPGYNRAAMDACKDFEMIILTSIRTKKDDKDIKYLNVKEVIVE